MLGQLRMSFALVAIATMITNADAQSLTDTGVKVFSLQRGVFTKPKTTVFVRYDFPNTTKTYSDLTVCYRIRVERFSEYNIHLSYAVSHKEANSILFYNMATEMLAYVHNLKQPLKPNRPLEVFPETWNHFCHVLTQNDYEIYWQGEIYSSTKISPTKRFLLNGTILIGQEQDSLGGTFAASQVLQGDISQLSIWDKRLSSIEIQDLANCREAGRGNLFSLDTARVNMLGDVQDTVVKVGDLCQTSSQYLVLPERRSVSAALQQCHLLNASMIVPESGEDNARLQRVLTPFIESCSSTPWKVWLGITDETNEGVWLDINGQKPVKYQNFVSPYPYGGDVENCAALLPDGTWGDAKCKLKKCSACEVESSKYLYLRGLCFEDEHETRFRVEGYVEGRPLFRGFYDLLIRWDSASAHWLLQNTANTTIASMSPFDLDEYPLGQHEWIMQYLMCGAHVGTPVSLSLSPCTSSHFMCRSGECLAHKYRCNLRFECEDGSDEDDCDVVRLDSGYRNHLPPPGMNRLPLQLALNFTLTRFAAIDTIKMSMTVEFQVSISWKDNRLSFSHLESTKNKAVLTLRDVNKIWVPNYRLLHLEGGIVQLLEHTVVVNSAANPRLPDVNDIKMDLMYPGADNKLTLIQDYTANFACSIKFLAFPFDVQVCDIFLRFPQSYEDFVQVSTENRSVSFVGIQELALFEVDDVRHGPNQDSYEVHVEVVLSCYGNSLLLSFIIPCIMLLMLSWSTLFINWEAFTIRVMISFGTLPVFYMLRLTLMANTPVTMAVKFLDVWVLFIAFILFINIIIHIFVRETNADDYYMRNKPLLMRPAGGSVVITPESSKPSYIKLLQLYRVIVLPTVIILFNIIFWATLFALR